MKKLNTHIDPVMKTAVTASFCFSLSFSPHRSGIGAAAMYTSKTKPYHPWSFDRGGVILTHWLLCKDFSIGMPL